MSDHRDQGEWGERADPATYPVEPGEDPAIFADAPDDDLGAGAGADEPETDETETDEPRPVRRRSGLLSCLVILVVLAGVGVAGAYVVGAGMDRFRDAFSSPEDYEGEGTGSVLVEVQQGESVSAIARNLERDNVVASAEAFVEAAQDEPQATGIQVGFYELREEMSAAAALEVLIDPGNLVQDTVTIPEGLRVEQTLARLAENTEATLEELEAAAEDAEAIGLPEYAEGNPEGYLFPATYAIRPDADAVSILSTMVDRWRQAADEAQLEERAEALGYTPGEVMVVASLVEAEANREQDRGRVARVIYNRLETDVTNNLLQIDATVNYALGRDLGLGLTQEDLQVDSPYNTRRYPGLPPGPIESPGDAAIEAAANPPEGDWVYYVTVDLETGETKFTDDYQEFLGFKEELDDWCAGSDRC